VKLFGFHKKRGKAAVFTGIALDFQNRPTRVISSAAAV
jgi:hypothetical protein